MFLLRANLDADSDGRRLLDTHVWIRHFQLNGLLEPGFSPVDVNGQRYFYFPRPYPCVRVKADWKNVTDLATYEAYTCLKPGAKFDDAKTELAQAGEVRLHLADGGLDPVRRLAPPGVRLPR